MKKNIILILVVIILILGISSCAKKIIYSAPTQDEVDTFISEKSLNVLAVKEAEEFTIILFQNGLNSGHYILYRDQYDKLYNSFLQGISQGDNPIIAGGVASGKEPFVTVIINDEEILKEASYVEVTFDDGNTVRQEIDGKGVILAYSNKKNDKAISYNNLKIYDNDTNLLYEN